MLDIRTGIQITFEQLRTKLAGAEIQPEDFKKELVGTSPNPKELFQVIVILLSASTIEEKRGLLDVVREYAKDNHDAPEASPLQGTANAKTTPSFLDAKNLVDFCSMKLREAVGVTEGKEGRSAAEEKALLLARTQNAARLAIKNKKLTPQDRQTFEDPVGDLSIRDRGAFLMGLGTINPNALNI